MAVHCPECGFANPEGANYCQKCGAYLGGPKEAGDDPTTMTYRVDETGEMTPVDIDDLGSLNGTYVNRRRIESHRLADGDEIQVGKYKLSYLER